MSIRVSSANVFKRLLTKMYIFSTNNIDWWYLIWLCLPLLCIYQFLVLFVPWTNTYEYYEESCLEVSRRTIRVSGATSHFPHYNPFKYRVLDGIMSWAGDKHGYYDRFFREVLFGSFKQKGLVLNNEHWKQKKRYAHFWSLVVHNNARPHSVDVTKGLLDEFQ